MHRERGVDLFAHGLGQTVVADHHDRVEMVRIGALFLALGGAELDRGHAPIIGAA